VRLGFAIGHDADEEALRRFIADPDVPVLRAECAEDIAPRLVAASIAVSRMSEAGIDRASIAQTVLAETPRSSAVFPDSDSIV